MERTDAGNLNIITDDAEGDAVDTNLLTHNCGNRDYVSQMLPGDRCKHCGWDYPVRVDVTTMSDDHRMRLNLRTGLIEKGENLAEEVARLADKRRRDMLDDAGILWRYNTTGRFDSSKPNTANAPKEHRGGRSKTR